ncbi:MAG TPA: sensor domain-containing diguanylate cyclase [Anaerolineales bacterium]|nr:sensor domain-containing diguanylate cyclase [Anaerolineales bacterium]
MPEEKDFYKGIIDNLYDGVYFVDRQRLITYWNKGAERITGYCSDQVVGRSCGDNMLNHVTEGGSQLCNDGCPLAACMLDGQPREADVFLHHADGHRVPVLVRAAALRDADGNILGAVETFSNDTGLTSIRTELRELRHSAHTDPLTGAANRLYMEQRLHGAIAELQQQAQAGSALLFIDIDRFKSFNDRYGHEIGDKALRVVSATLRHNTRETDVVARWGGDEFVVLLHDVASLEALRALADKLRMLVECSRLDLETGSLTITVSVGGTLILPHDDPESVVRRADVLMYRNKPGGNQVHLG